MALNKSMLFMLFYLIFGTMVPVESEAMHGVLHSVGNHVWANKFKYGAGAVALVGAAYFGMKKYRPVGGHNSESKLSADELSNIQNSIESQYAKCLRFKNDESENANAFDKLSYVEKNRIEDIYIKFKKFLLSNSKDVKANYIVAALACHYQGLEESLINIIPNLIIVEENNGFNNENEFILNNFFICSHLNDYQPKNNDEQQAISALGKRSHNLYMADDIEKGTVDRL